MAAFFEVPSSLGVTSVERSKFLDLLLRLETLGLGLIARDSSLLESLKGEHNLYAMRLMTRNNPRVLLCALPTRRSLVLLHAFKEHDHQDYGRAIKKARRLRDLVVSDPGRWVYPWP